MICTEIKQGDILKIEKTKEPVLVTSKDFFNRSGEIIGCPVFAVSTPGPLHIYIETDNTKGFVQCDKLKLLDLNVRRFSVKDHLPIKDVMNVTDAIQGIFDYI